MDFGIIVDVETTGLDPAKDKIIEIGILEFAVGADSKPHLVRTYGGLADPGIPLDPEIQRLTGLNDAVLAGQAIDREMVRGFFSRASVVVAHNAEFDRRFIEASGLITDIHPHWACSMRHIDWRKRHFNSLGLNYLAADHGFINPFAHRAVFDCATTFRLIGPYLDEMVERSYEREFLVKAVGSPFETKDILRARGYRWDPEERCWTRVLSETELTDERAYLAEHVYKGRGAAQELEIS